MRGRGDLPCVIHTCTHVAQRAKGRGEGGGVGRGHLPCTDTPAHVLHKDLGPKSSLTPHNQILVE